MPENMRWYLLKSNKCPKCASYLTGDGMLKCSKPKCDFIISEDKFKELSNKFVQKYNSKVKVDTSTGWGRFEE